MELGEGAAPRWNFHKYVIGPDGELTSWFPTRVRPESLRLIAAIEAVLPK